MKQQKIRAKNYAVGYKRPPQHSQFKKGQSGNPKGRRKKMDEGLAECFMRVFGETVQVREGDRIYKMSTEEAMFRKLKTRILLGDAKAFAAYLDIAKKLGMLEAIQRDASVHIKFLD